MVVGNPFIKGRRWECREILFSEFENNFWDHWKTREKWSLNVCLRNSWRTYVYYNFFCTESNIEFSKSLRAKAVLKWEKWCCLFYFIYLFIHLFKNIYQIPTVSGIGTTSLHGIVGSSWHWKKANLCLNSVLPLIR